MLTTMKWWMRVQLIACAALVVAGLTACGDLLGFASLPTDFELELTTNSDLGAPTLRRLDELRRTIERGAEVGPETRALIDRLNETLRQVNEQGLQAQGTVGVEAATLQRIDTLLSIIEDDLGIRVDAGLDQPTIEMVNRLADSIDAAPGNWEAAAEAIIQTLENSTTAVGRTMAAEIKGVLDRAKANAQGVSAALGQEARCNVDFMGARLDGSVAEFVGRSVVGQIRTVLAGEPQPVTEKPAKVCQIIPDQLTLIQSGELLLYNGEPLRLSGYDLTETNMPEAFIADEQGQRIGNLSLYPLRTSDYQLQLNLQGLDFRPFPARAKLVFQWRNGNGGTPSHSEIAIVLPALPTPTFTPEPVAQLTIRAQAINVREGPGTNYGVIGLAEAGATFVVLGSNGDGSWWQIRYGSGVGWVFSDLVQRNELPVAVVGDIPLPPTATFTPVPADTATNTPEPPPAVPTDTPAPAATATNTPEPPTATSTPTPTATFTPVPPTPVIRYLLINGNVRIRDDETFGSDERKEATVSENFTLTPPDVTKSYAADWCAGDEVRGELHLQFDLVDGGLIRVSGRALYFEGTSCDTGDLEKTQDIQVEIPANEARALEVHMGDGDGDVDLALTLQNLSP